MDNIELIVGLGNPGTKYSQTRHNAGAEYVEQLASKLLVTLSADKKYLGLYAKAILNGKSIHLLIPTTYMNLSGSSVAALANFYKIPAENILVVHDELDIGPGTARFKKSGGHGGHNGLRDIISKLGNNKNFYRLRIGIGHPGQAKDVANFVLSKAPSSEQQMTQAATDEALDQTADAVKGDWNIAMNKLHSFKAS
ncbi:MAG: aminoacyl-tRNA hydrolase [Pseudomonadales bacterium]|nr:aminoacyl-tRNA hydrolase [Pseudomonadales bacterium]NRA15285.1 aminoacyl-tRNA hydrolase [Oceanospirillaceae bacterium]